MLSSVVKIWTDNSNNSIGVKRASNTVDVREQSCCHVVSGVWNSSWHTNWTALALTHHHVSNFTKQRAAQRNLIYVRCPRGYDGDRQMLAVPASSSVHIRRTALVRRQVRVQCLSGENSFLSNTTEGQIANTTTPGCCSADRLAGGQPITVDHPASVTRVLCSAVVPMNDRTALVPSLSLMASL